MEKEKEVLQIRQYFLNSQETIAVAESVTSGLMQFFFSTIPDAGKFYQGGITAYNLGQKYKHLNVEPIHAQDNNCVSSRVAEQMAIEVCHLFRSDWGIATTGYANPVPESDHKLFAHYAISYKGEIKTAGKIDAVGSEPENVQRFYRNLVVDKFLEVIQQV